jgi:hypothetical protein
MLDYVSFQGRWILRGEREELVGRKQDKIYPARRTAPEAKRSRPQPEISPGYVYFGIPPSPPPRGSERHGGYDSNYSFAYPFFGASGYGGRTMMDTGISR